MADAYFSKPEGDPSTDRRQAVAGDRCRIAASRCFLKSTICFLLLATGVGCGVGPGVLRTIELVTPEDGAVIEEGTEIEFLARGRDFQGSTELMGDTSYLWLSDRDGQLGIYQLIKRSDLSVGDHTITVKGEQQFDPDDDLKTSKGFDEFSFAESSIMISIVAGSAEGEGDGEGEGEGESEGEGAGESTCDVVEFLEPETLLNDVLELTLVDFALDLDDQVHLFYIRRIGDDDNIVTEAIYRDPFGAETIVATGTRSSAVDYQGDFLSDPHIAVSRMGSIYVQYLQVSSSVDDEWIAHKRPFDETNFGTGFQAVQRDFQFPEALDFSVDLKSFGDDQAANAVIRRSFTEIEGGEESRTQLVVNILDVGGIERILTVADETQTFTDDFSTCNGLELLLRNAATGPNRIFSVIVRVNGCGGIRNGALYRFNNGAEDFIGPFPVELDPPSGFLGPHVFDELGRRHQMRVTQVMAKGVTVYDWGIQYRNPIGDEILAYETTQTTGPATCEGVSLTTIPGTQIGVGPTGRIAILFGANDCDQFVSARVTLASVQCSDP